MKNIRNFLLLLVITIFFISCGDDGPVTPEKTPKITSIERSAVLPNDEMLIIGTNFGTERGSSLVKFDNLTVDVYLSWSDTLIKVVVPAITSGGTLKVETPEGISNEISYTIDNGPRITSAGNSRAYIDQDVEIIGLNLGSSPGEVFFNGTKANIIKSWSSTKIQTIVPIGATSGNLTVKTSDGKTSPGFYFTIASDSDPFINTIFPATTSVGTIIKVSGKNFGTTQGTSYVDFDGIKGTEYSLWTKDSIRVKVPSGAITGLVRVFVGSQASNSINITILSQDPPPYISSLSKTSFAGDETISIIGKNFGTTKAENASVLFNGISASDYISWEPTLIKVVVPMNAASGKIMVKIGLLTSNLVDYTISTGSQSPVITGINPANAASGQTVYIAGKYFGGTSGGDSYVMFGSVKAVTFEYWNNSEIGVVVPEMPSGQTQVKVFAGGKESNTWNFNVNSKPIDIVPTVEIPAGTFIMGSSSSNDGDAYPSHKVTLTSPLWVGKYEVTQAQYKKVMNQSNPSRIKSDNNPVEQISWMEAIVFCNRVSKLEGLKECYTIEGNDVTVNMSNNGYRLLTEAEWEYACRAGSTGRYGMVKGAEGELNKLGWNAQNTSEIKNVGLLLANDFGLYDMHGNAAEWVWDYYDFYESDDKTNPTGPNDGAERVFRGGGYIDGPKNVSSFVRASANQSQYQYYIGFRVCRTK